MANCKDEIKRITKDLVDKYVKGLCDKIKKMNTEPDFVRNDYVRGKKADHHIMYKLNCDGNLWLEGDDGRKYEFLVEFDKKDIVRHQLVQRIVEAYEKWDKAKKESDNPSNNENEEINQ